VVSETKGDVSPGITKPLHYHGANPAQRPHCISSTWWCQADQSLMMLAREHGAEPTGQPEGAAVAHRHTVIPRPSFELFRSPATRAPVLLSSVANVVHQSEASVSIAPSRESNMDRVSVHTRRQWPQA
jgi:hypothetical protein